MGEWLTAEENRRRQADMAKIAQEAHNFPSITAGAFFVNDDPRLARRVRGHIAQRHKELAEQLAGGFAQDWPDYKYRVGYLRALEDAMTMCDECEKELTR